MAPNLSVPGLGRPPLALLVDRDADTRQMYAEFLQQAGCDTLQAEDGREALAQAVARHPDIIVTETRLPGISGLDLCQLLRQDGLTADIRIVFVTGDAFEHELTADRAAGADAVLVKPCLPSQLAEVIVDVLHRALELGQRVNRLEEKIGDQRRRTTGLAADSPMIRALTTPTLGPKAGLPVKAINPPPNLLCPTCSRPLRYLKSYVGGVGAKRQEQWDYFDCAHRCGTFQYRQRTRKLRRVS